MDPAYLARRSALISPDRTMARVVAGTPAGAPKVSCVAAPVPERGTSHFVAVDSHGNVASETSTIESVFGSGLMVSGYYLNNELTDFNIVPDKDGCPTANRVEGGKRPRSSMSPTIVYGPGRTRRLAVGAAGGATIPAQVLKAIIGVVDWHLSAQQAIALPMLFAPGDTVYVEKGSYLEAMIPQLQALGQTVEAREPGFKANAIERVGGRWVGAADPAARALRFRNRGEFGSATRTFRQSRIVVPDARRREGRQAVPVGQARRPVARNQLGGSGAAGRGARGIAETDRAASPATASRWSARTGLSG